MQVNHSSLAAQIQASCRKYPVIVILGSEKACKLLAIQELLPTYHFVDLKDDISIRNQIRLDPEAFLNLYAEIGIIISSYQELALDSCVVARSREYVQLITSIAAGSPHLLPKNALPIINTISKNPVTVHTLIENPEKELGIDQPGQMKAQINKDDFNSIVILPSFHSLISELQKEQ